MGSNRNAVLYLTNGKHFHVEECVSDVLFDLNAYYEETYPKIAFYKAHVITGAAIHIRMTDIAAVLEDTDENERKSRGERGNGYEGSYGYQYE